MPSSSWHGSNRAYFCQGERSFNPAGAGFARHLAALDLRILRFFPEIHVPSRDERTPGPATATRSSHVGNPRTGRFRFNRSAFSFGRGGDNESGLHAVSIIFAKVVLGQT